MRAIILSYIIFILTASSTVGQDLSKSFNHAFKKSDSDSLLALLVQWNNSIKSNESEVSDDKYCKAVYSIFNEFYTPFDLARIGSSEWGDSIYRDKFAIIQNKVNYAITEFPNPDSIIIQLKEESISLSEFEKKFGDEHHMYGYYKDLKYPDTRELDKVEITKFRPKTTLPVDKRLYLTTKYQTELIQFLGNQHSPIGEGGIMNPARATKKTWKRQNFLNEYLNVIYGHWGGYWHLETHPEVSLVVINPELTKAVLYFRIVYEGGEAYLENNNGKWTLIESKLTWIE